jgi:hypothetical protein
MVRGKLVVNYDFSVATGKQMTVLWIPHHLYSLTGKVKYQADNWRKTVRSVMATICIT